LSIDSVSYCTPHVMVEVLESEDQDRVRQGLNAPQNQGPFSNLEEKRVLLAALDSFR